MAGMYRVPWFSCVDGLISASLTPPKPFVSVVKHLIAGHLNDILAWF